MREMLSLRARLAIAATSLLVSGLLVAFGGILYWVSGSVHTEQRRGALLHSHEFERAVLAIVSERGTLQPSPTLQQLVHSRWIREAGLLRVSIFRRDGTIVADSELPQIGLMAPSGWHSTESSSRLQEVVDKAGQITFITRIVNPAGDRVASIALQLLPASDIAELPRVIHSILWIVIPGLLASVTLLVAASAVVARRTLRHACRLLEVDPPPAADAEESSNHVPRSMARQLDAMEHAAQRLRDLAAR